MKRFVLALLVATSSLTSFSTSVAAEDMPTEPIITFTAFDGYLIPGSFGNESDSVIIKFRFTAYAPSGLGDIHFATRLRPGSSDNPVLDHIVGIHTWTPNAASTISPILAASVLEVLGGVDAGNAGVYTVREGHTGVFDLNMYFRAGQESGFFGANLSGIAWGSTPTGITHVIGGDSLSDFRSSMFFLRGSAVPEPSSAMLGALGVWGLIVRRHHLRS